MIYKSLLEIIETNEEAVNKNPYPLEMEDVLLDKTKTL